MKTWLFIGRLNPPHIGHIKIIDKALKENDKVLLLIWTTFERDFNNPLDFVQIKNLLTKKYPENKLYIEELKDDKSDLVWIYNIYKNLYKLWLKDKNLNIYWGDKTNDTAYLTIKKYEHIFSEYHINYIEIERENHFISYKWVNYPVSATNLRKALREKNIDLAEQFCDREMFEEIKNLKI